MRFFLFTFIMILATLFYNNPCSAKVGINSPLQIILKANGQDYLLNEPLMVRVILKNRGNKTLYITTRLDEPDSNILTFDVRNNLNEKIGFFPSFHRHVAYHPTKYKGLSLEPGNQLIANVDLSNQRGPSLTGSTGHYHLQAFYNWKSDWPALTKLSERSTPLKYTVHAPTGNDLSFFRMISTIPKLNRNSMADIIRQYNDALTAYPTSRYAPHIRVQLAKMLMDSGIINQASIHLLSALKEYKYIIKEEKSIIYRDIAREMEAHCLLAIGRKKEAVEKYKALLSDPFFPNTTKRHIEARIQSLHLDN
jgi:hypothetical protein